MNRYKAYTALVILAFSFFIFLPKAFPWGFHAHKKINREAVLGLPTQLLGFYNKYIDYISDHAVDPDNKKYVDSSEAHKHFIDIDHYGAKAFDVLPKYWKAAVEKYTRDTLEKYGTLPWEVMYWEDKLTQAFKEKNGNEILKASANIGHYIADAHVPLHTVSNYDGQKTNQLGIHGLWETSVPDMFADKYVFPRNKVVYIKNPEVAIFEIIQHSYLQVPIVFAAEKFVDKGFPKGKKYKPTKSRNDKKEFTVAYITAYNKALNGMVERQMVSSALDVSDFWFTAWVNAGQPDLSTIVVK